MEPLVLNSGEKFQIRLNLKDASGDPTTNLGGREIQYTVQDPEIGNIAPSPDDPFLFYGIAGEKAGVNQYVFRLVKPDAEDIVGEARNETLPGEVYMVETTITKAE